MDHRLPVQAEDRGVRLSEPRKQVLQVIESLPQAFSAGDLLDAVGAQAPSVGRATVFRTIQVLIEAKLLERVRLGNGEDAYVAGHRSAHHHHLICRDCGDVQEVSGCRVSALASEIANERGFTVENHCFDIYGICPSCQPSR